MRQFIGLAACVLPMTSGCSTLNVSHDWDPQAQFSQYRTWTWMAGSPAPTGDPRIDDNTLLHDRTKREVEVKSS